MKEESAYRIMGIDPGTNYMGYGILEVEGRKLRSVVLGDIDLHTMSDPYRKLRYIFDRVSKLVDDYSPREVALESPVFGANVQSMLKLGRAQGVAIAAHQPLQPRADGAGGDIRALSLRNSLRIKEERLKRLKVREVKG